MVEKIPVVGIDNSGKTSLIRTFQREFKALTKLKPTKGIERTKLSFLGKDIVIWDFGGQDKFRKKYMNHPEMNFTDLEELFFVIDVQDQNTFADVINYFQMLRTALMEYSPDVRMNVILHKYDPGMEQDPNWVKYLHTVAEKFKELANPLDVKIYETSIFNPLSVVHAMSQAVLGNSILTGNLEVVFHEFITKNNLEQIVHFMLIYSEDVVEIGSYFNEAADRTALQTVATDIFAMFQPKTLKLQSAEFTIESSHMSVMVDQIRSSAQQFYLLVGYYPTKLENLDDLREKVKAIIEHIEKLMLFL